MAVQLAEGAKNIESGRNGKLKTREYFCELDDMFFSDGCEQYLDGEP